MGRDNVDDLVIGEPADSLYGDIAKLEITSPSGLDDIDTGEPLPLEVIGETDLGAGTVVAYGLNGQIAAITEVESAERNRAHALLVPESFVDGENLLTAYVVEGPAGGATLHPLDIAM
jgi:hypothetical protein